MLNEYTIADLRSNCLVDLVDDPIDFSLEENQIPALGSRVNLYPHEGYRGEVFVKPFAGAVIPQHVIDKKLDEFVLELMKGDGSGNRDRKVLLVNIQEGGSYFNQEVLKRIKTHNWGMYSQDPLTVRVVSMKAKSYTGHERGELEIIAEPGEDITAHASTNWLVGPLYQALPDGIKEKIEDVWRKRHPVDFSWYNETFVLDDILDTGETARMVVEYLEDHGARDVQANFMTVKDIERSPEGLEWIKRYNDKMPNVFYIPNEFVAGAGLDWSIPPPTQQRLSELELYPDEVSMDARGIHIGRYLPGGGIVAVNTQILDPLTKAYYTDPEAILPQLQNLGIVTYR